MTYQIKIMKRVLNCVAVPSARILGGPDLHVDIGSTINLTCLIQFSPEPPAYIFWYHEEEVSGRKVIIHATLLLTSLARKLAEELPERSTINIKSLAIGISAKLSNL